MLKNRPIKIILFFLALLANIAPALAAKDFNIKNNAQSFFYVNGTSGNIGIGSVTPGQLLDVNGTARMTGFTLSNNGAGAGNVMVTNGVGVGTWMPVSTLNISGTNYWLNTAAAGNVGISTTNTVGIGTTSGGAGSGLLIMNGNVGIGTWAPQGALDIKTGGNVLVESGNVGIGSTAPGAVLDVQGTVRLAGLEGGIALAQSSTALALGTAPGGGTITSSGRGSIAVGDDEGGSASSILSSGPGSIAAGQPGGAGPLVSIISSGAGSLAMGFTTGAASASTVTASGNGSLAMGYGNNGTLQATGIASFAMGQNVQAIANNTFALGLSVVNPNASSFMVGFNPTPTLTVTGTGVGIGTSSPFGGGLIVLPATTGNVGIGSLTPGQALDVQGTLRLSQNLELGAAVATGSNNTALGLTISTGTITSSGGGSIAAGVSSTGGTITSSGGGAFAGGYAWNPSGTSASIVSNSNGSFAYGYSESTSGVTSLTSGGPGSVAFGYAQANGAPTSILSNGTGSFAMGYAINGTVAANGTGSVAMGQNVQAIGSSNSFALGESVVNPNNSSFMVGFNPTPTLTVTGTGVGIGTSSPFGGGLIVLPTNTGNVGIGSLTPGQALDVQGTARMTGFTLSNNGVANGNVMVTNGIGVGTWMPVSTLNISGTNYWLNTAAAGNVGISTTNTVGIGTTFAGAGAGLLVMNGNVGIGTWAPTQKLAVIGGALLENQNGAAADTVLIGDPPLGGFPGIWLGSNAAAPTYSNYSFLSDGTGGNLFDAPTGQLTRFRINNAATLTAGGAGVRIFGADTGNPADAPLYPFQVQTASSNFTVISSGNVGIGSVAPGQKLDVLGTVRTTGFTMSGQTPISGYVMTASDSAGDTTWTAAGVAGGWTVSGNNVYETSSGNVGIGTSALQTALAITNGNVGIGTWTAAGGNLIVNGGGNVGIGSAWPGTALDVQGTAGSTVRFLNNIEQGGTLASGPNNATALGNASGGGTITSSSNGSFAGGYSSKGGTGASIISNTLGSFAFGESSSSTSTTSLSSTGGGSMAIGAVNDTGTPSSLSASGVGSMAMGYVVNGTLLSSNFGTIAMGEANSGTLQATSGAGSVAMGYALGGTLQSTGGGSFAVGFANSISPLQATGQASVAMGQDVQANASNAFALGLSVVNPNASSFMVGFNPTPTLTVTGTGVGIGTSSPFGGGLIVLPVNSGNVGIGSLTPGQALDVKGTVRTTGFTMSGQTPISGYVMTASDSAGDTTWTAAGVAGGWTVSGNNVYETSSGNVGIGTSALQTALAITNGNVGIGTWTAANGALIVQGGNVGIGTFLPGELLALKTNVTGTGIGVDGAANISPKYVLSNSGLTIFTAGLAMANGAYSNSSVTGDSVLRVVNSSGNALRIENQESGSIIFSYGATAAVTESMRIAPNGNVGIGTITPVAALSVVGNIGIGTGINSAYVTTAPPSGGMIVQGNVGIGSLTPGQVLDVKGTVRTTGFTMSEQTPISGYVMTASDSAGDATWTSAGGVSGWTVTGNNIYETGSGNVGIGTITPVAKLEVAGSGVGIGTNMNDAYLTTTPPSGGMIVQGNVGIGSVAPQGPLDVESTTTANSLAPINSTSFLTVIPSGVGVGTYAAATDIIAFSGNGTSAQLDGVIGDVNIFSGNVGTSIGMIFASQNLGTGTVTSDIGTDAFANNVSTGTITSAVGTLSTANNTGTGPMTTGVGIEGSVQNNSTGTVTTAYGGLFNISNPSGTVTNGYGLFTGIIQATNKWSIYSSDSTAPNYFAGNVGIGTFNPFGGNLIVKGGGNVGIGSLAPGQVLDVQGNLRATGGIVNGNIGIGTSALQTAFAVANGNVGIGTWTAGGGALIVSSGVGNVGIGSAWPGMLLDIAGGARMTGFTLTGNGAAPGSIMVTNTIGVGTWMPINTIAGAGGINSSVANQIAFYLSPSLSQTITSSSSMVFNAPNVGLGTVTPLATLQVVGNIGIGTVKNGDRFITTSPPNGGMIIEGNVGIGTATPLARMQVSGQYNSIRLNNGNQAGASMTIDWNGGNVQAVTLTGSITTLTLNNPVAGGRYLLEIKQGGAGGFTITWPGTVVWPSATAPTLTVTAGQTDIITLYYNGTNYAGFYSLNYII